MSDAIRILIAGVGNELLSDDGVGIHAARELQKDPLAGVEVLEIGTAILHGMSSLENVDRVLVIDAARGGQPPGTVYLYEPADDTRDRAVNSVHALGLRAAAGFLMADGTVPKFTVLGVEPASLDCGMNLSASVQAALPRVIALARQTVAGWRDGELTRAAGNLSLIES